MFAAGLPCFLCSVLSVSDPAPRFTESAVGAGSLCAGKFIHSSGAINYRKSFLLLLQDVLEFHRLNPRVSPWITKLLP